MHPDADTSRNVQHRFPIEREAPLKDETALVMLYEVPTLSILEKILFSSFSTLTLARERFQALLPNPLANIGKLIFVIETLQMPRSGVQ